jgi:hypothetical protein
LRHERAKPKPRGTGEADAADALTLAQKLHVGADGLERFAHFLSSPAPVQTFAPVAPQQYLNFLPLPMGHGALRAKTGPL